MQINSSESTLIINYIDAGTGRSCNLTTIATSSFIGGVYKHIFPVSSSTCTDNPDINVTVSTGSDVHNIIDSVKIG